MSINISSKWQVTRAPAMSWMRYQRYAGLDEGNFVEGTRVDRLQVISLKVQYSRASVLPAPRPGAAQSREQ